MTEQQNQTSAALTHAVPQVRSVFLTLLPIVISVYIGFLIIGMQMPVLPLHLHGTLGQSTLVVGLVIGSQFVAALLSRSWAGNFADIHGAKRAMVIGLLVTAGSGILYLLSLLFTAHSWGNASLAFTALGLAFIAARVAFGHLPDKLGGARVALICVVIEAVGQLFIWRADTASLAYLGAALTGFGYSLAFPGFGVEAVRRAPPQTRSLAMGAYVAFLDVSLGITAPLAGALAGKWGINAVYLASAAAVALSAAVALALLNRGTNRAG